MELKDSVALVTGANRGLGQAFAKALLAAGAKKVYAAARDPASVKLDGVVPLKLDVTNPADIAAAVEGCGDLTLLVNNAGIARGSSSLAPGSVEAARAELETNYFGPLAMTQAFAPVLARNGGGAIVNVLSVLAWLTLPGAGTYCASKAAAWSLSNSSRNELKGQGTQVLALHVGLMDTDMTKGFDAPKSDPADVVRQTLEALAAGRSEVLADAPSRHVKAGLAAEPPSYMGWAD